MVTERREYTEGQSHKVNFEIVEVPGSTNVSQSKKNEAKKLDEVVWTKMMAKMRWLEHKIINTGKAKEVTKNKGKGVVELKFEEDRPKTIKKVIEVISTNEQEPSVLNSKIDTAEPTTS